MINHVRSTTSRHVCKKSTLATCLAHILSRQTTYRTVYVLERDPPQNLFCRYPPSILVPLLPFEETVDSIYSSPRSHLLQRILVFLRSNPSQIQAPRRDPRLGAYDQEDSCFTRWCTSLATRVVWRDPS